MIVFESTFNTSDLDVFSSSLSTPSFSGTNNFLLKLAHFRSQKTYKQGPLPPKMRPLKTYVASLSK